MQSFPNKTALSASTNRFLGGDSPSIYLKRLQEKQKLAPGEIDGFLNTHFVDPTRLRGDDLTGMMVAGAEALASEIVQATGRPATGAAFSEIFGGAAATDEAADDLAA